MHQVDKNHSSPLGPPSEENNGLKHSKRAAAGIKGRTSTRPKQLRPSGNYHSGADHNVNGLPLKFHSQQLLFVFLLSGPLFARSMIIRAGLSRQSSCQWILPAPPRHCRRCAFP